MSSKSFSGSVTVGGTPYQVTATLVKRGLKILGHVTFNDDRELILPIAFLLQSSGTTFTTPVSTWFTAPGGEAVELLNLDPAESSTDAGFTEVNIIAADCAINGLPGLMSMNLDSEAELPEELGVAGSADAIQRLSRRVLQPIRVNEVGNTTDHFGSLVSLSRNTREGGARYASRIRDAVANPGAAHYRGVLNGIKRELMLVEEDAIQVSIRPAPSGARSEVRFVLDGEEVRIYAKWVPFDQQESVVQPVLEMATPLEDLTVVRLVDWINTSENFQAKLLGAGESRAAGLVISDSWFLAEEELQGQEILELSYRNLIPGTLSFSPVRELAEEVEASTALTRFGQYKIDYEAGHIKSFRPVPSSTNFVYTVGAEKLVLKWSPARIVDFTSEAGQDYLFNQIEREFYGSELSRYVNGLPKNEAYRIMRDILTAPQYPQFWGE